MGMQVPYSVDPEMPEEKALWRGIEVFGRNFP
jgi:hypothetical protein